MKIEINISDTSGSAGAWYYRYDRDDELIAAGYCDSESEARMRAVSAVLFSLSSYVNDTFDQEKSGGER